MTTLLAYEVSAPETTGEVLSEVCSKTDLELTKRKAEIVCGPFLSRYEASLWAGLTPGGRVSERDQFVEPATTEPWERASAPYERRAASVMTRQLWSSRFALVEWELGDEAALAKRLLLEREESANGQPPPEPTPGEEPALVAPPPRELVERELYQIEGRSPRFLSKLPLLGAFDSSSGYGMVRANEENTFLQVVEERQTANGKREKLVGWRFAVQGREKVFEAPFTSYEVGESEATLTVTRVSPAPEAVALKRHRVVLRFVAGAPRDAVIFNDWVSPRWAGKPPSALGTIGSIEREEERIETVTIMGE